MKNEKGREFKGLFGGNNYQRFAKLFGMKKDFYHKGIDNVTLLKGKKALDLGCGTGNLSFALAEKAQYGSEIIGIDISDDQLNYARNQTNGYKCNLQFKKMSMDFLEFPDNYFDIVITCMALHETPPTIRRKAIKETARVLKPGCKFILVDWSKPKFGFLGIIWFPIVRWGEKNKDNWNNVYPELCENQNLILFADSYINSIARRQAYEKSKSN